MVPWCQWVNSLRPRQNGRLFADDTFKRIFLNENIIISTKNSLKFVLKGLINNIPALVLIVAWRRPGDKPLSEPMMVSSPTHICVTRPQWVNEATVSYKQIVVFPVDVFWLPTPPQWWEILGNAQHNSVGKRLIFTYGGNAHIVRVLRSLLQNGLPRINTLLHVCIFSWSNTRAYSQTK